MIMTVIIIMMVCITEYFKLNLVMFWQEIQIRFLFAINLSLM